jgi:hypothetical protein
MKYDVFISYRREGGYFPAQAMYDRLKMDKYRVHFDLDTLRNGDFDEALYQRIDECTDFVIILNKGVFDRCFTTPKEDDWLRIELAYALEKGKNIVPITLDEDFKFPKNLPEDIAKVTKKNALEYHKRFSNAFYSYLENKFLLSKPISEPKPKPNTHKWLIFFACLAGGESRSITVKQEGILLEVTPKKLEFSRDGESQIIRIKRNVDKVKIDDSGLEQFFNIEEQNSDSIIIAAGKNVSVNQRKSRIIITAGEVEEIINLVQSGEEVSLTVAADSVFFNGNGGVQTVQINTNSDYIEITSTSNIKAEQIESGYISITVPQNDYQSEKTGTVTIKADTLVSHIIVKQAKRLHWLRVKDPCQTWSIPFLGTYGYATKYWKYSNDDAKWGVFEEGGEMAGFRLAVFRADPYFAPNLFGLGLHTGLYYQYYSANQNLIRTPPTKKSNIHTVNM